MSGSFFKLLGFVLNAVEPIIDYRASVPQISSSKPQDWGLDVGNHNLTMETAVDRMETS